MSYHVHVKATNIQFTHEQLIALEQHLRGLYLRERGGDEVSLSREIARDITESRWQVDAEDPEGERLVRIWWLLGELESWWEVMSYFPYGDHRVPRHYEITWPDDISLHDDEGAMEDLKRCFLPVLPEGGYLEMAGEDDTTWRYVCEGGDVVQKHPKVTW